MKSASSRRKVDVFLQNHIFLTIMIEILKEFNEVRESSEKIDVSLKQNNDMR